MKPSGRINKLERYCQQYDYSGLIFERNISPSDIDFDIEFGGKQRILGEFKSNHTQMPFGQRLSLSRLLKCCYESNVSVLGFVARHFTEPHEIVKADQCLVTEFWIDPVCGWQKVYGDRRLRDFIDSWRTWDLRKRSDEAA